MNKYEKVEKIAEKLMNKDFEHKNLLYNKDWNGFSGTRGNFIGGYMPFCSYLIGNVMLEKSPKGEYYLDPGICIFDKNINEIIDTIYWYDNPEKILEYFPSSKL